MAEKQRKIFKVDKFCDVILDSNETGERTARFFLAGEKVPLLVVEQVVTQNGKFATKTEAIADNGRTVFTKVEEYEQIALAHLLAGVVFGFFTRFQGQDPEFDPDWMDQLVEKMSKIGLGYE